MLNETEKRSNRIKLLLILAMFSAPVIAGYLVYYFWKPQTFVNYGELITPQPLPDTKLELMDGAPFALSQLKGKWIYLSIDSGDCAAECTQKLYTMRQVRLTQGKDMERIARVWLIDDESRPRANLTEEYSGTWIVKTDRRFSASFPAKVFRHEHIYLIDPLGNLMMRYPQNAEPGKMVKDIKRLLKVSQIG